MTRSITHLLFLFVCLLQVAWAEASTNQVARPVHESLIEALKRHDGVLPPVPDVHPVRSVSNREAIIPPQCYTRNLGNFNPCYVCHQAAIPGRENVMNDDDLQEAYSFSDVGMTNQWKNLFEDRSIRIGKISDKQILEYIDQDNFSELAPRLDEAGFKGYIPRLKNLHLGREAFDENGFALDGSHWVAFNYKPFPSTFWPANGSTDDVMIRLPEAYRSTPDGKFSEDVYRANLAMVEAAIKGFESITCLPVDEEIIGEDLDGNGSLGIAREIVSADRYVGAAKGLTFARHLYPEGTEFLHTVRYIGLGEKGGIVPAKRMKELRYMKKWRYYSNRVYGRHYELESFEKEAGNLPGYHNIGQHGLDNGNGWSISGFIENNKGRLRAYTYEENFSCVGCHNSIGSTIDKTFSLPRKVDGAAGWGYIDLHDMKDAPTLGETKGEIATYMERVGGGSEFRNNEEMRERWFLPDGSLNHAKVKGSADVYELITPSRKRALNLNKAYYTIVKDQDYIYGKDATVTPPENVFQHINNDTATTLPSERQFRWNILLDWSTGIQKKALKTP